MKDADKIDLFLLVHTILESSLTDNIIVIKFHRRFSDYTSQSLLVVDSFSSYFEFSLSTISSSSAKLLLGL